MIADVTRFGAVADGVTDNTAAFARAVEACAAAGGGVVQVPAGQYVSGTIRLQSHVYLELLPGSEILGSRRWADYSGTVRGCAWKKDAAWRINPKIAPDSSLVNPCRSLVVAEDCHHVGVYGTGTLNGRRGAAYPDDPEAGNPFLVVFSHCQHVLLADVTMTAPGSFTNYLLACRYVVIRGLHIDSTGTRCGDGIDFDGGQDVTISNCVIDAGDDGIGLKTLTPEEPCERFTITGCTIRSHFWGCVRIGPETAGDYRHITVSDCVFYDSNDGLKLQLCEERVFEDFTFSNITMQQVTRPFFITLTHYPFSIHSTSVRPPLGVMRRLHFAHISAHMTDRRHLPGVGPYLPYCGCVLYSLPGGRLEDVTFTDVHLHAAGGGEPAWADRADHAEMLDFVQQYPESCLVIGPPPAAAFYMRHAARVTLRDVTVTCQAPDPRPALAAEDVADLYLDHVTAVDTAGLLRQYECPGLQTVGCRGAVTTLSPAGEAAYAAARQTARQTEAQMAAMARLIDGCAGQTPLATFEGEQGYAGDLQAGDVLVLPLTAAPVTVWVNDQPAAVLDLPAAYRTLTHMAYAFTQNHPGAVLRVTAAEAKAPARLYRKG